MKKFTAEEKIEEYCAEYHLSGTNTPHILIAEVLVEIRDCLESIASKLYE